MRFILWLSVFALLATPNPSSLSGAEPEALLWDIEGKWKGKIVRDDKDSVRPVVEISFHCDSDVPDVVIKQLTAFPRLRQLGLIGGQRLTDQGLEYVGKLATLESLSLRNQFVTADGLKHLARLPTLKTLLLWDIPLTEQNATAIAGCRALERLELRAVEVSPEAVESLKKLPRLKELDGFQTRGAFQSADDVQKALPGVKVRVSQ